eukprot:4301550-Prymnesium_polylepis.1
MKQSVQQIPGNLRFEDHGITWEVEHKIPLSAYDHDKAEDVRRCWSPENMRACSKIENRKKSYKIYDHLCLEVGTDKYPIAWNSSLPTAEEKLAFYQSARSMNIE